MKKNISINISGIIFHIEEDGFDNLRRYLDSINKYFSSFEDSSEIMADIESRIAEIFLSKLNEGKQVITAEDVNALITTMGSVSDFKAAEEQEFTETRSAGSQSHEEPSGSATGEGTYTPQKPLSRDQKRKVLGGVCAGLASYLKVDVLWVRLLFAVLAFAWGFTIFVYIIMWIVVPGSYDLEEVETGKRMYRDPERKVLGGVAGGVASYLNIDILAVRVLFIIFTLMGGLGLFLYIILWIILPEARTLTDRMQMQGEPVTLSNIEMNIKKNQDADANAEESTLTKILLFPFRVIAAVLQALAKVIVPLVELLRVAIGVFIVLLGISLVFALVVTGGAALGIFSAATFAQGWAFRFDEVSIPVEAFTNAFPGWIALACFVGAMIPCLFIVMLGVSVIAQRVVFGATIGWSLFVIFFVCVAIMGVGIPKIIYSFKEYGEYTVENTYRPAGKTAVFKVRESGLDDYRGARLWLKGYAGKEFKVVQTFGAKGSTRQIAIENAQMVDYGIDLKDSVFTFDSNIHFKKDAIFRDQRLDLNVYIPYNYPFIIDKEFRNFVYEPGVDYNYRDGYTWIMTEKGIQCVTCPQPTQEEIAKLELRDFDELELHGIFDVRIYEGHDFSVSIDGTENEKKKYKIYRSGETLIIEFEGKKSFKWDWNLDKNIVDEVRINITMPRLEKLEATGYGSVRFDKFRMDEMEIEIRGPIKVKGEVEANKVFISLTGKSELDLNGRSEKMNADIEFASKLKAYNFEVRDALVEVKGASTAKVNVTGTLEMDEGVASDIDYRGNPNVIRHD